MREWHRLFFVNERRLRNFIARGAVDADSPAIRLVGMPKVDCWWMARSGATTSSRRSDWIPRKAHGALRANLVPGVVAERHGRRALGRARSHAGERDLKLHDRSRDLRAVLGRCGLGGETAAAPAARARRHGARPRHFPLPGGSRPDDHRSQLGRVRVPVRDRPLVRIHRPQLIELANVHPDYVALLTTVSRSVDDLADAVAAGTGPCRSRRTERRAAPRGCRSLLQAGRRRSRSVKLYDVLELEPAPAVCQAIRRHDAKLWPQSA